MRVVKRAFAMNAVAALLVGCSNSHQVALLHDTQVKKVHSVLHHLDATRQFDAKVRDYVNTCEQSDTFRVQARLQPVVFEAVHIGALTQSQGAAIYAKMAVRHPDEKKYWDGVTDALARGSRRGP